MRGVFRSVGFNYMVVGHRETWLLVEPMATCGLLAEAVVRMGFEAAQIIFESVRLAKAWPKPSHGLARHWPGVAQSLASPGPPRLGQAPAKL